MVRVVGMLLCLSAVDSGCGSGTINVTDSSVTHPDYTIYLDTGGDSKIADSAPADHTLLDLPANAGDPCWGKCAGDLICMAAICHQMCDQPDTKCYDKVADCPDHTACLPASDFADVCYPASGTPGTKCGTGTGVICEGGTLCVNLGGGIIRCLGLCKYGCNGGVCQPTTSGCQVCIK